MSKPISDYLENIPARHVRHLAGKTLFHQHDAVRSLHLVLEGEIHLLRHDARGRAVILQRARQGAILAEASLFSSTYHCDALAIVPSHTKVFSVADIRRKLSADPGFSQSWAAHLAREVQSARMRAEILSMTRVSDRLDSWIVWNNGHLPAKGDGRHVAGEIGVSPEALYRELARRRKMTGRPRRPDRGGG